MSQKERLIERQAHSSEDAGTKTFGELNFGGAQLGDARRTKRLLRVADAIARHPGGSLPEKMGTPAELEALYHLMKCSKFQFRTFSGSSGEGCEVREQVTINIALCGVERHVR